MSEITVTALILFVGRGGVVFWQVSVSSSEFLCFPRDQALHMDETDILSDYVDRFIQRFPRREALDLVLVGLGDRPACLVMDPGEEKGLLRSYCDSLGLAFRSYGGDSELARSGFFIAREKKRLEILENSEGRFYGLSDRDVGRFLGFPEDDIDYFRHKVGEKDLESGAREKARDMASEGHLEEGSEEMLRLVTYVPRPEKENIVRAVKRGREHRNSLLKLGRERDRCFARLLETVLDRPVDL